MGLLFTPEIAINPPQLDHLDSRTVYFKTHNEQIEIFKFTRHSTGDHIKKGGYIYPDRIGKRYKPYMLLKKDQASWTLPTKLFLKKHRNNYFKFCFRGEDGKRTSLSSFTIQTIKFYDMHHFVYTRIRLSKS